MQVDIYIDYINIYVCLKVTFVSERSSLLKRRYQNKADNPFTVLSEQLL